MTATVRDEPDQARSAKFMAIVKAADRLEREGLYVEIDESGLIIKVNGMLIGVI